MRPLRSISSWLQIRCLGLLMFGAPLLGGCPSNDSNNGDGSDNGTVTPPVNRAPVANAGADQTVAPNDSVTLIGNQSSDPDGDRLLYIWQQVTGDPTVELQGGFSSIVRFVAPEVTEETVLTFRLTVVDSLAANADEMSVTVRP